MSIRNRLAAWLGIDQLEQSLARVNEKVQTREDMRKEVCVVLSNLLDRASAQSETSMHLWYDGSAVDVMTLRNAIERMTSETARKTAEYAIASRVDTEQFIDAVVDRILRKQLGGK